MGIITFILAMLSAFGPLSIDMYLPALPRIAADFATPLSSVQLSLASFFIGIAAGQLIYGPITDRFGRKKPLYFGLALYLIASVLCASSINVNALIAYRLLQALGACAGMVIGRAIVRDLYPPHESAKVFSLIMLIMGVAPILAPMLGGVLAATLGWRAIFWFLAGASALALLAVHFFLQETHTSQMNTPQGVWQRYREILRDKNFTGYTLSLSFIYAGIFSYITGSSFVFIEHYGLSPGQYSWVFGINAFGIIFFSQLNGRLLKRWAPQVLLEKAIPIAALAGLLVLLQGILQGPIWTMCLTLFIFATTLGMIAPNGAACALAHQKQAAGSASALMGTFQFGISALASSLVSHLHNGTILPMCAVIFICGALSLASYMIFVNGYFARSVS